MSGYLIDANVISELTRDAPSPLVVAFLNRHDDLWLSSIVGHELEYGVQLLPSGRRRALLESMQSMIVSAYEGRILLQDRASAEWAARLRAEARQAGHTVDLSDALIAGTARAHDLIVATRNVSDFHDLDVEVINPWEQE